VVTVTLVRPRLPAGVVTVTDVAVFAVIVAAAEPKSTAVAPPRFAPEIVTEVPPARAPKYVLSEVMVGGDFR
jgi:hypothetical protein